MGVMENVYQPWEVFMSQAWAKLGFWVLFGWMWFFACQTLGASFILGGFVAVLLSLLQVFPFGMAWALLGLALSGLTWMILRPRSRS